MNLAARYYFIISSVVTSSAYLHRVPVPRTHARTNSYGVECIFNEIIFLYAETARSFGRCLFVSSSSSSGGGGGSELSGDVRRV